MRFSADEFASLVEEALEDVPAPFAAYMREVMVEIESMPDADTCRTMGLTDPRALLGLYQGLPLTERSVEHVTRMPDRITIYQRNIERISRTRSSTIRQIRKTVFHEVGHHFGLSEDDLEELGYR